MNFKQFFYENVDESLSIPKPITVHYMASDGHTKEEIYSGPDAREKAKAFIDDYVGLNGEIGGLANYIVSSDGMGRVAVKGIDIHELLGREDEKPAKESTPGYVKGLGETAMLLNAPIILEEARKHPHAELHAENGSLVYDWSVDTKGEWGKELQHWRFVFSCSFDEYNNKAPLYTSLNIFYNTSRDQKRLVDVNKNFPISGDRDEDLRNVESVLKQGGKLIKMIEEQIKSSRLKLS